MFQIQKEPIEVTKLNGVTLSSGPGTRGLPMASLLTLAVPTTTELPFAICTAVERAGLPFLLCFRYTSKIRTTKSRTDNAIATGTT